MDSKNIINAKMTFLMGRPLKNLIEKRYKEPKVHLTDERHYTFHNVLLGTTSDDRRFFFIGETSYSLKSPKNVTYTLRYRYTAGARKWLEQKELLKICRFPGAGFMKLLSEFGWKSVELKDDSLWKN